MAGYDDRNTIILFENDSDNDKAPVLNGKFTDGDNKVWEVALWQRTGKEGYFYSGVVKEPYKRDEVPQKAKEVVLQDIDDDPVDLKDIPF